MTDIQITNAALVSIGCNPISSFDDDSSEARVALALYRTNVNIVLEERQWTFAKARSSQLVKSAIAPEFGYKFAYMVPADSITIIRLDEADGTPVDDWVREGHAILADHDDPVYCEYTRECSESEFSPGFTNALIAKLACEFAGPLTENRNLIADWTQKYEHRLVKAAANDGLQGRSQQKTVPYMPGRRRLAR